MIEAADAILTGLVGGAVILTPKSHRRVAWLLFAEFCIFVGLDVYMKTKGMGATPEMYAVRSLVYTAFTLIFMIAGSKWLAFISILISFYQAAGVWLMSALWFDEAHYFGVMLTFCILQIGGLLPGVLHGRRLELRNSTSERRDDTRHYSSG
jgi:hypothetical protein